MLTPRLDPTLRFKLKFKLGLRGPPDHYLAARNTLGMLYESQAGGAPALIEHRIGFHTLGGPSSLYPLGDGAR